MCFEWEMKSEMKLDSEHYKQFWTWQTWNACNMENTIFFLRLYANSITLCNFNNFNIGTVNLSCYAKPAENFAFINVIAISLFIIQLSFARSPAFYFRKNLWAHISFYSTCFWYYRKHPHNDNKICPLLYSAETTSRKNITKI